MTLCALFSCRDARRESNCSKSSLGAFAFLCQTLDLVLHCRKFFLCAHAHAFTCAHARLQLWGAYCKWKGIPALAHQRFWSQVHARTHARTHAHSHNSLSLSLSDTHTHAHAQAHKFNSIHTRTCTHTLAMDNLHSCKHQGVFLHPAPPNPRPLHLLLNLHLLFPTTVCVRVRLCVGVVLACVQNRKVQGAAV